MDEDWLSLLREVIMLVVSGLLIPVAIQFLRDRGLKIEEKHAAHIQLTAENAAALMLDPSLSWEEKRSRAMGYMRTGAGDAINYFKADQDRLFMIVLTYYNRMKGGLTLDPLDKRLDIDQALVGT